MARGVARRESEAWLYTRARGKKRFILGQMLSTGVTVLLTAIAIDWLNRQGTSHSVRSTVFSLVILLPIALLGGYLTGNWKWKDLERRFPDDTLPPWN